MVQIKHALSEDKKHHIITFKSSKGEYILKGVTMGSMMDGYEKLFGQRADEADEWGKPMEDECAREIWKLAIGLKYVRDHSAEK